MKLRDQLSDKNEELKKVNKELDHFVYATSHELRSPLTSILGILNLMEKDISGINTTKHIQLIRDGIKRVDVFVKRVLAYSQNSRTSLEIEIIHFEDIITDVINTYQSENIGIHFIKGINEYNPFYSDAKRVRVIFENLISNAVKYSSQFGKTPFIEIQIKCKVDRAIIVVIDNGIGIAPAHQKKVFDMFYRVSTEKSGTGLGLYLVKELVEKLKGKIELESKLAQGTKFIITLLNLKNERT